MKNSADRGGCYPPRSKAGVNNTIRDLQNSSYLTQPHSKIIALLFIQNNSNFKNKPKMFTSVDVKFTSIVHLFWEIYQIKVCSGLQIYVLQIADVVRQVDFSLFLLCFSQYFAVKRVQCPPDSSAILFKNFVQTTKTTQPLRQVSSVNGSI